MAKGKDSKKNQKKEAAKTPKQKKELEEQRKQEAETKNFRRMIENLVNRAEKIEREYNTAFKKAVKEGNLNIESKYPKIIKRRETIYKKNMANKTCQL